MSRTATHVTAYLRILTCVRCVRLHLPAHSGHQGGQGAGLPPAPPAGSCHCVRTSTGPLAPPPQGGRCGPACLCPVRTLRSCGPSHHCPLSAREGCSYLRPGARSGSDWRAGRTTEPPLGPARCSTLPQRYSSPPYYRVSSPTQGAWAGCTCRYPPSRGY